MAPDSTVAIFIVLAVSYLIAWWSIRHYRQRMVHIHLFGGNTPVLGLSSNVGAIVSMAIAFTALLSGGFVFGWQILFPIAAGGAAGLAVIIRFSNRADTVESRGESVSGDHRWGISYLALLADDREKSFLLFYGVAIVFYAAMLATELAVLRGLLHFFVPLPELELGLLLLVILVVCCSYVFLGGFRGVLMTDYFQLLVVIALFGASGSRVLPTRIAGALPSMSDAAIRWTPVTLTLLHLGVFIGAFGWALANVDQWNRTIGTLTHPLGERTLKWSALITFSIATVPVIVGSAALKAGLPRSVGNAASLHLLQKLWASGNTTFRFIFVMALTCAALTTLNTYIISIEQLYYEFTIRMNATETADQEGIRLIASWKENRLVASIAVAVSYLGSFAITERSVYAVGVTALCGYLFFVPALLSETVRKRCSLRKRTADAKSLLTTILVTPLTALFLDRVVGTISVHLYLIPVAIAMAAGIAYVFSFVFRPGRKVLAWKN